MTARDGILSEDELRAAFYAPTFGGQSESASELRRLRAVEAAVAEKIKAAADYYAYHWQSEDLRDFAERVLAHGEVIRVSRRQEEGK